MENCCESVEKDIERVISKFKAVGAYSCRTLEELISSVHGIRNELNEGSGFLTPGHTVTLQECLRKVKDTVNQVALHHRELHSSVSRVGKVIDKSFVSDLSAVSYDMKGNDRLKLLNEVVCEHFLRQGQLDVAESLIEEAELDLCDDEKQPFLGIHGIVDSLARRDTQPALEWAEANRAHLEAHQSPLEFNLHKLRFLGLLESGDSGVMKALVYAKNFQRFASTHSQDIQQLMGRLIYSPRQSNSSFTSNGHLLDCSPYALSPSAMSTLWSETCDQFTRDACAMLGLPVDSPLRVSVDAGTHAIGPLLSIKAVLQQRHLTTVSNGREELPVQIDLGHEARFHSIFACPILRQQTSESNPPMRLVCGHVISKDAMNRLSNGSKLKCPYCPVEQAVADAVQLHL